MKVMTIVGTRPEIIRLSSTIKVLDECCDHILVHTGQNYDFELNEIFFEDLGLRSPDFFLEAAGESACDTVGNIISSSYHLMQSLKPDALLILGDTNSCMSVYAAKRLKIPTFHMEAGNRCFDQRVPEEINRRLVDHISDVNLPYSEAARLNLLREGLPSDLILKTGSPMREVLSSQMEKISTSNILGKMNLGEKNYFVVSLHREENVSSEKKFKLFLEMLNGLGHEFKLPIIVSTHPRTRKLLQKVDIDMDPLVVFSKPLSFSDYNCLQMNSKYSLSDSGTISEESAILGFRAINLRDTHERPEAMEAGIVPFIKPCLADVLNGISIIDSLDHHIDTDPCPVDDYNSTDVSAKVAKIILSYTAYVNRVVWSI